MGAIADKFPGAIYPLAPPDSGFPSFFNVLAIEVIFFGSAEAYRTGVLDPVFDDAKLAEREIIHGRFAMLGLTGAWASEVGTGIPWFEAGALCTPSDCTAIADKFPGAIYPLAPPDSGFPSFFNVLAIEVIFFGS